MCATETSERVYACKSPADFVKAFYTHITHVQYCK